MVLSRSEFDKTCLSLVKKYQNLSSTSPQISIFQRWIWNEHTSIPRLGYLSRTAVMTRSGWDDRLSDLQEGFNINDSPDEATAIASNDIVSSHQFIVYSQTYQVPVFYFTIQDPTGSPLPLSDIVRTSLFWPSVLDGLEATTFALTPPASSFPLLSQGDHPTLGTPCWYIHPCEMAKSVEELISEMNLMELSQEQRLVRWLETWFMVMGSVVNLRLN